MHYPKFLKKILKVQINDFVRDVNLLCSEQSGFRRGHSTTTAFLKVHDDIHSAIDKKAVAFLLLVDFSKAFDRVSHSKLLNKLSTQFMFSRAAVGLIQSYLTSRSQIVTTDGSYSNRIEILSGVPQGSILGPLVFSLFINDLSSILRNCTVHMFADDVQINFYSLDLSLQSMANLINDDLTRILAWSESNLLPINSSKTKVMLISRNRNINEYPEIKLGNHVVIEYVSKASILGFIVQNDFEWESHINYQCAKIYNGLRILKLSASKLPTAVKVKLCKALILPHFLYGDVFLLNASAAALNRLRIALNCCVRFVFCLSRYS